MKLSKWNNKFWMFLRELNLNYLVITASFIVLLIVLDTINMAAILPEVYGPCKINLAIMPKESSVDGDMLDGPILSNQELIEELRLQLLSANYQHRWRSDVAW